MSTIRPFRWHDWLRFMRLGKQGLNLDTQTSLVQGTALLGKTLRASLPADVGGFPTYVVRQDGRSAVGQLRHATGEPHAHVAFAAPLPDSNADLALWEALMEALTAAAGQRGATNVLAEIDERSPAFEGLRHVGFAIYARQEIWWRQPAEVPTGALSSVRACRPEDEFHANVLYANVVPGLLRQVEPAPELTGSALVLAEDDAMLALVTVQRGPLGSLLEAFVHPAAEDRLSEVIRGALWRVGADENTVYFRVRRHQGWLAERLVLHGFELMGQQAVMVKHTVARVEQPTFQPLSVLDGGVQAPRPTQVVTDDGSRQATRGVAGH